MARLCGEAHLQVKMHKAQHSSTTFWVLRCSKSGTPLWHEASFARDNVKSMKALGRFFGVSMSQSGKLLWREVHLQVNMYETPAVSGR